MANGLITAGIIGGFGQGLADASKQGMQIAGFDMLAKERQKGEMARLEVMERYAAARDERNQDFQRGLQQERIGADVVNRSMDRQAQADLEKNRQDFEAGREQQRAGNQIALDTIKGERDERQHKERMDVEKGQAKAQEAHYNATQQHYKQMEAIARLQHGDEVREVLKPDEQGRHFALMKSGKIQQLMDPESGKPIIGAKGLSESSKHLADLYKDRSAALEKLASDPLTPPDEAQRLRQESQEMFQRAASIFGEKPTAVAGEGPAIKDRFKASAPASPEAPGQSAPPPRREKTVPAEPAPTFSAGPTDALSFAGEKIKEGATGLINSAKEAFMPNAPAPTVAKESREQATAALSGGTPDQVIAEKQQESQQRERQIAKPKGSGLISMSEASVPPPSAQPAPQARPQPQERPAPQGRQPAQQNSGPAALNDLLSPLPKETQQKVKADLNAAIQQFQSGALSEEAFRNAVFMAWLPVPGSGTDASMQSRAIADFYIAQRKKGS